MAPSAPDPFEPTAVHIDDGQQVLRVEWADGHAAALPYRYVRGLCPCAVCQGHGGDLTFVAPLPGAPLALAEVLEVGHYALNLVWQDGHRTGIYSLRYLRSLCVCAACRRRLGAAHGLERVPATLRAEFAAEPLEPASP